MSPMEWTQLGILAGLIVTGAGYLSRQIHREVDGLRQELLPRLDRLDERYIRHLEQHASN